MKIEEIIHILNDKINVISGMTNRTNVEKNYLFYKGLNTFKG